MRQYITMKNPMPYNVYRWKCWVLLTSESDFGQTVASSANVVDASQVQNESHLRFRGAEEGEEVPLLSTFNDLASNLCSTQSSLVLHNVLRLNHPESSGVRLSYEFRSETLPTYTCMGVFETKSIANAPERLPSLGISQLSEQLIFR